MSNINCGINPLKKGERRGTMMECLKKGQVRYYGLHKIDQRLVKSFQDSKKGPKTRDDAYAEMKALERRSQVLIKQRKEEKEKNGESKQLKQIRTKLEALKPKYLAAKKLFEKLDKAEKKTRDKSSKSSKTSKKSKKSKKTKKSKKQKGGARPHPSQDGRRKIRRRRKASE